MPPRTATPQPTSSPTMPDSTTPQTNTEMRDARSRYLEQTRGKTEQDDPALKAARQDLEKVLNSAQVKDLLSGDAKALLLKKLVSESTDDNELRCRITKEQALEAVAVAQKLQAQGMSAEDVRKGMDLTLFMGGVAEVLHVFKENGFAELVKPRYRPPQPTDVDTRERKGDQYSAEATFYYPADNALQGGFKDRRGAKLQTVQDFIKGNADYISVAIDIKGDMAQRFPYGTEIAIPELEDFYRKTYNLAPDFKFKWKLVDTGGAFYHKGTGRLDICTGGYDKAYNEGGRRNVSWYVVEPNGERRDS